MAAWASALGDRRRIRRFAVVGGVAAWRLPVVTALLAAGALALDAWEALAAVVAAGGMAHHICRNLAIEVSPTTLTRGLALRGGFVGHAAVLPWPAVVDVRTDWCRPGDDLALETAILGADGTTIRFSTSMGLRAYWACLAEIAGRATGATRSGLTDTVLAEGPPARRQVLSALTTAGALALVLVAMVGLYYVLAQGRSSLSRYLEDAGAASTESSRR
jgi:hypothetical protein